MKKASYLALALLFVSFSAPVLASAQVCPPPLVVNYGLTGGPCVAASGVSGSGGSTGVNAAAIAPFTTGIIDIINKFLVPLLFAVSFITFLYGVAKTYILSHGEKAEEGHQLILWGIIGFVVMVSVWALVNIVASTFNLGNTGPITNWPTSR